MAEDAPLLPAVRDTSYEVAIDDEPDRSPVAVDPAPPAGQRLPVVPHHLRTPAGVRAAVGRHAGELAHRGAYHVVRSPKYLLVSAWFALAGAWRLAVRYWRWWQISGAPKTDDPAQWTSVQATVAEARKNRSRGTVLLLLGGCALAGAAVTAPWWVWPPAVLAVLVPLSRAGKPAGKRIVTPAVVTPRFRVLNADIVLRAYYAAGLGHPDKPGQQVTFGSPMARDGEGSRVLVDLPYGKGLDHAIKVRPDIASGLDVQVSQVFLHRDPTSHRRHVLWVADRDPLAVPVGRTPLLACRATDVWKPAPLGLDERGQLVSVPLMWNSLLIGALPRQGKTFVARKLGLFLALDPYVKLDVFDAKGSPDWRKFALVADSCAFGLTPTRDGLPPEILLATLESIKRDAQERYHRLSKMPVSVCPEGKLTRRIARDPDMGMPVRALLLDEFQEWFDLGEISKEIAALLVFLAKVAPGAGIILVDATQKPSGVGTGQVGQMFTAFRDNHQIRFSLRTSSYNVSEMVLGQGAYGEGLDSSTLLPQYKGVGILRGASDVSPTVRTYLADGKDAEKILVAARALREQAGTLSGMALGEESSQPVRDVLGDVLAVFGEDSQLHWGMLAARLGQRFPERWQDTTAEAVSAQCRDLGVRSADVRFPPGRLGTVRKGCYRAEVQEAAARGTAGQEG